MNQWRRCQTADPSDVHHALTWLTADFAVQAAATNFTGTSTAVTSCVNTSVEAASSAAKDDFLLINGISVSNTHLVVVVGVVVGLKRSSNPLTQKKRVELLL